MGLFENRTPQRLVIVFSNQNAIFWHSSFLMTHSNKACCEYISLLIQLSREQPGTNEDMQDLEGTSAADASMGSNGEQ